MLENYDHAIFIKNIDTIHLRNQDTDDILSTLDKCKIIEETFKVYLNSRLIKIHTDLKNNILCIGLILNKNDLNVINEKGPVYGTVDAINFKKLWGEKSVMKFIDGNIHECVSWPKQGNLLLKIVDFIMKEKLGFPSHGNKGGWHQVYSNQLNSFIRKATIILPKKNENINIKDAYTILKELLCGGTVPKSIKNLPVNIHDVRPIGAWSKYTNVFSEQCISVNGFSNDTSIDQINSIYYVSLNVEVNNKWPSDQDVLFFMKSILFIHISKALFKEKKINSKLLKSGYLDIHVKGYIFRCYLVIVKELNNAVKLSNYVDIVTVGKKRKKSQNNILNEVFGKPLLTLPTSIRKLLFKNDFIPKINNQIRTFSAQLGQVYTETCRVVKRWMSSHYINILDDHDKEITQMYLTINENSKNRLYGYCFSEVAIELIIASLFLNPNKEYIRAPQSIMSAFIRFLRFFSEFDWLHIPLVINIDSAFSEIQLLKLSEPFRSIHRHIELPAMVIRTPIDHVGDRWTCQGPNNDTLKTIKMLTKKAYITVQHLLENDIDVKPLFLIDKVQFNVLFHLKFSVSSLYIDKFVDKTVQEISFIKREKMEKMGNKMTFKHWPKDFDDNPILNLIQWIKAIVEPDALCSYDKYGGRFIGLRWLQLNADKELIIKAILYKGKMFISKCEIFE